MFDVPAAVTELGQSFTEIIRPGAFQRTLAANGEVIATIEHDPATTFARRSAGLILQEDGRGLFASAYLEPSPANDRILKDVSAGRITGASFRFRDAIRGRTITTTQSGLSTHLVTDVDLIDVTLSRGNQVYRETSVSVRSDPTAALWIRLRILKARR